MAQIRNVSGQALDVPGYGVIDDDEVFEVPDGDVYSYTVSANFAPVDSDADQAHSAGEEAERAAVEAERAARGVPVQDVPGYDGKPPLAAEVIDVLADAPEELVRAILAAEQQLDTPRVTVVAAVEKRLAEIANPGGA